MKNFTKSNFNSKFAYVLTLLLFISIASTGQISVTTNDMPNIGDTIRLSTNVTTGNIDYTLTGENYTWDFSSLFPLVQTVDTFLSVSSVPFLYQLVFIPNIVANLAQPYSGFDLIPGLDIDDPFRFYMNSNSTYKDVGFAVTFNSIPLPIKFDSPDIIYDFPVNYGNADSSFSGFELGLAGLGFAGIDRKRVNNVDGWGTVITPYGTFDALRVKSQVTESDTIYIDSIGFGTTIERNYIEYKWLGNDLGLPILQVTEEGPVVTIAYLDSIRNPITTVKDIETAESSMNIFPNPARDKLTIILFNDKFGPADIALFSTTGIKFAEVFNGNIQSGEYAFKIRMNELPAGLYFVKAVLNDRTITQKIIIE